VQRFTEYLNEISTGMELGVVSMWEEVAVTVTVKDLLNTAMRKMGMTMRMMQLIWLFLGNLPFTLILEKPQGSAA
jgi:hypothetical protein